MKIRLHPRFKKAYKNRIKPNKKLITQMEERINRFKNNPRDPILKNHPLKGQKEALRAFSITGDIRVIYQPISEGEVIFIDIGSHNQVY